MQHPMLQHACDATRTRCITQRNAQIALHWCSSRTPRCRCPPSSCRPVASRRRRTGQATTARRSHTGAATHVRRRCRVLTSILWHAKPPTLGLRPPRPAPRMAPARTTEVRGRFGHIGPGPASHTRPGTGQPHRPGTGQPHRPGTSRVVSTQGRTLSPRGLRRARPVSQGVLRVLQGLR